MYDPTLDVYRFALEARFGRKLDNEELFQAIERCPDHHPFHARKKRVVEDKECPNCGKLFTPKIFNGKEQKFCSNECRVAYVNEHSKCNNPYETDWTGRPLTEIQRQMVRLINRPLEQGEYAVKIGDGPSDYRIMTKSDKAKFTHNEGSKYRMVEDGDFMAHMELDPNNEDVAVCERCQKLFIKRPGVADNRFCVECRAFLRSKEGKTTYMMGNRLYVKDPENPNANNSGLVAEYIIIAQQMLNRPMMPGEVVHHRDHDTTNNDPSNLMVFASQHDHMMYHRRGELGCKLYHHPNGSYVTIPMKQIVDIVPPEKRSIPANGQR